MFRSTGWIILFCVEILVGLGDATTSNAAIFQNMSVDEIRSFFGTEDGSVPKFELVKLTKPARSKRDANVLNIPFKYDDTWMNATLYFVPDHELISPTSTAVWFAETNRQAYHDVAYTPKPNILDDIGTFKFYHNQEECSAITKFWSSRSGVTMIGVLKQDYTVRTLPQEWLFGYDIGFTYINSSHTIVSRSADSESDQDEDPPLYLVIFKNEIPPKEYFRRYNRRRPTVPGRKLDGSRPRSRLRPLPEALNPPNIVYPKILITPTYEVVMSEGSVENYIMLMIAHLNAMDMMYRQLRSPEVRLKIGGIIIPLDPSATPYIAPNTERSTSYNADDVLNRATKFFRSEVDRLQGDTYSAFVVLATELLYDHDPDGTRVPVVGLAYTASGCEEGGAMVNYRRGFGGVMMIAHELGHVFNARHDGSNSTCGVDGGYTMVDDLTEGKRLKWSTCTQESFRKFFRSEVAKCTHSHPRGIPQSVHSMPGSWISLLGQCQNRMKNAIHNNCDYSVGKCRTFYCSPRQGSCQLTSDPPMDGSLGTVGGKEMRCVNQWWYNV